MDETDEPEPTTMNSSLLQQAADAAKQQVKEQIRDVLREASLQALRTQLNVEHGKVSLLTPTSHAAVNEFCLKLAVAWSTSLRQMGHDTAALWVQDVVDRNSGTLYCAPEQRATNYMNDDPVAAVANQKSGNSQTRAKLQISTALTTWGELRTLGHHDLLSNSPPDQVKIEEESILALQNLGRMNKAYWPQRDWKDVEKAVSSIPARLHNTAAAKMKISGRMQNRDGSQDAVPEADNVQLLLDRKRKSTSKKRLNRPAKRLSSNDRVRTSLSCTEHDQPRSASSDDGTARFLASDLIGSERLATQKACLHIPASTTDSNSAPTTHSFKNMLLGSLQDVGHFHFFNQLGTDDRDTVDWTAKQRRRHQREHVSVRLGDHETIRDERQKTRTSRVVRTHDSQDRTWLDFDLGHCILEGVSDDGSSNPKRTMYAFSNIEVLLIDENETPCDW